jgi:hypothetical protein
VIHLIGEPRMNPPHPVLCTPDPGCVHQCLVCSGLDRYRTSMMPLTIISRSVRYRKLRCCHQTVPPRSPLVENASNRHSLVRSACILRVRGRSLGLPSRPTSKRTTAVRAVEPSTWISSIPVRTSVCMSHHQRLESWIEFGRTAPGGTPG